MIPKVELSQARGRRCWPRCGGADRPGDPVADWDGRPAPGSSLDRTALVEPLKYLSLSGVERRGNTASVLGQFVNTGMAAFVWEELGLWASRSRRRARS